jgi:hypothetical protein
MAARRRNLRSQASRLTLRSTVAAAAFVGLGVFAPSEAWAQCAVGAVTVTCGDTSTTDTTFPTNPPVDRNYQGILPTPIVATVNSGATISGNGLAFTNNGTGGITVTNGGTISVDAGNTPTAGGTAALSVTALGGPIVYTGGDIINNGNGNAFDARQTGGVGSVSITAGNITAANGEGITVRDVATSTGIDISTGNVTALTAGKDGIDAQSQSLTGNITEVANGDINAGNAGMVAAILNAAGTGSINVTANGAMTARFGVDAENFGSGNTFVTTVGPVNVTTGNGIFALSTGGHVIVNAGDVNSTSNTAIIAQQTKVAGAGLVGVTAGNVSGTTGIDVHNFGTGDIGVVANGTVTGTAAEGIKAVGNAGVFVSVSNTVTGATRGLSLVGGTGGTGDIFVTGTGGFVGGTGDAANILNNGSGGVTVNISGASSSAGGEGIFVRDTAAGGNISVTTGAVTALTAGKDAIDVQAQTLTGGITEVANGDINAGNAGMVAALLNAAATGNIDVTANGAMTARFGVDAENFGSGSTSVTTVGPVNVTTGNGIFALTTGGTVTVNAGDVTSTGNTAIIAQQTKVAGAGNVDVTAGNVSGTTGIDAHNFGTGTVSVTANGTVTGTAAEGIKATGNGAVTINVADTVTGATRGLSLVGGTGGAGNISVTGTGGFVGGTGDAANILNNGSGTVTVDISGASSSAGGEGIFVRDTAAGGNISVTTGAVTALTAGKDGIDVQAQTLTGNVTEVANGDINAGNAGMVAALLNAGATGNIDVTANGSIDARFGVDAENFGSGSTSVTTVGPVNVTTGNGIFALATGGNVVVNAGDVTSTGNTAIIAQQTKAAGTGAVIVGTTGNVSGTTGIDAHNFGTGLVGVVTGGTVTGTSAEGIKAVGNDIVIVTAFDTVTGATRGLSLIGGTGGAGNILVNGPGGFFGGTDDAVNIKNNGSGTVTVDISGASGSTGGEGIVVRDTTAGGDISVTTGAVTALTAGKDGIDVQAQSLTGNITIVANGDINAGNAGIVGALVQGAATGNIDITANGAITARFGIDAENFGTGNTTVTTVGPVNVTTGNGIFARTSGGNVTVNAGDVTATGNTAIIGRQTSAAGAGIIDITAGNVSGTTGIEATNSGTGATNVTTTGTVTGTLAEGIIATGNDAVTISVADTVTGATRGLSLVGGTGGAGDMSVTGTGGFFGGTGDAANILNNGSGTVTVDISGASSSTAGNGFIVRDTAIGGDISVTTGAVTALTAGKDGIDVQAQSLTGNVTIVANGDINAGNAGIVGAIFPAAGTGNIDITANGAITARFGIDAENFGTGNTTVTTVGPVNVTTGNGIFARTSGGNVTVNAGDVTATGNTAIIGRQTSAAGAGIIDITAGNVSGTTGIEATNSGTGATNVTTTGTVTGTLAEGIIATGNDAVTISVADTVTGATRGLSLVGGTGGAGDMSVTGTGGFFGGTGDAANILNNGSGTVTVDISGASSSTAGNGFIVRDTAIGGDISVTTGAVTALAVGKNAIDVHSQSLTANVTEIANGDIQAGNAGMVAAIFPAAATGNIDVTANGAITARFGIDAENFGTGNTTVTTIGPVTTTTGNGIYASTRGGNVSVTAGDVSSISDIAILAQQLLAGGTGNVDVSTSGTIAGTSGIYALTNGTGNVSVTAGGDVNSTSDAITALNNGAAVNAGTLNVTVATGTTTTSTAGNGILTNAGASTGLTTITLDGDVVGALDGVNATADTGALLINGSGSATGAGGNGITAFTNTGNIDILATGSATGSVSGIDAESIAGNVNIAGTGPVFGATGFGILGLSVGGNVSIDTAGPVTSTGGEGIRGLVDGLSTVSVTTGGVVTSNGIGIQTQSLDGLATITTNANVFADSVGILGNVVGAGSVTINANAGVSTTGGNGIIALLQGAGAGTINVNQGVGSLITATNGSGIRTNSGTSTGATTIVVAGEVRATGAGNAGVRATSTAGDIIVDVTATGKIDPAIGIALNTVNGALLINNAGSVSGTTTGVQLVATGSGTGTVNNFGTITGGTWSVVGNLNNRPFTLYNAGTLNGGVNVQGSTVAISNFINAPTGIANLTGASVFAGNLVNGGNINQGSGGSLLILGNTNNASRITFIGAGTFTTAGSMANTGIINAQNNLTTNVVTVGGNYTGGGQFFADYNTVTATADRLNIGGTASGNTNVTMNRVGANSFVPGGFLPVVTVAPGAAANAFTSSTVFPTTGFILESFGRNPATNTQFGLIQTVNPTAAALGNLSYMAESASGLLDDAISPFVTNRTDAGGTRFSLWMRGSGGHSTQTINSSLTGGGLSYTSTTRFRTSQHAAQIGGDVSFGGIGGGWKVNVGVMGGWYGASAPLAGGERIKVETPFVGGYAVVGNGAFELEGNIRKEWRHYTVAMPSLFGTVGTQRMRGDATAGSVRASYRIGTKIGFAATPFVSYNYGDTNIDPLVIGALSVWTPGSDTTKIGQAGLRLSYRGGSEATATVEPFISAARMENWSRGDTSSFGFGAPVTTFSLQTNTWKNAMRYSAGILANAHGSRVSGFVVGNIDDDSRLRSFTINAGLRFNF